LLFSFICVIILLGDNMNKFIVYAHINNENGKRYIGITSQNAERRWRDGKGYKNNIHFYRAIKKYGWNNFRHSIIAHGLLQDNAEALEKKLIKWYHTNDLNYGYNTTIGGDGLNGYIPTEEDKQKRSLRFSGIQNPFYGKHHSEQTIKHISLINKVKMKGNGNPFYGKSHSEETKEKIRIARTGKTMPDYVKKKIADSTTREKNHFYGKTHSEAQKEKWSGMRAGAGNPRAKAVDEYDLNGNYLNTYQTAKEAGEKLRICNTSITRCCKGQHKTAGGFIWEYHKER
jgi:group I intron endonuclease